MALRKEAAQSGRGLAAVWPGSHLVLVGDAQRFRLSHDPVEAPARRDVSTQGFCCLSVCLLWSASPQLSPPPPQR